MTERVEIRNAIFYFGSLIINLIFFIVAIIYIIQTISINAGRISDLALIDSKLKSLAIELTQNRTAEDIDLIRKAIGSNSGHRDKQKKDIDYGDKDFHGWGFKECAFPFHPGCFHRNSSWTNTAYLGIASGILGACLSFFLLLRNDAISGTRTMWAMSTPILLVCVLSIGSAIGLLTLFILHGVSGTVMTQISGVVQVESPFGVAFACTLTALFSERIFPTLARLLDTFKITASPKTEAGTG